MKARDRKVIAVVAAVALLAAWWMLAMAPKRAELAKLGDQIAEQETQRDAARAEVQAASRDRAGYAQAYADLVRMGKAVPADDASSSLVYQLEAAAQRTGIDFRALRVTDGAAAPAPSQPPQGEAKEGEGKDDKAKDGEAAAPAPAPGAAPAPGQAAATGPFTAQPLQFTFDGGFHAMDRFLAAVDRFTRVRDGQIVVRGRLLTIEGIAIQAGRKGFPSVKATVTASAYALPDGQEVLGAQGAPAPQGDPS